MRLSICIPTYNRADYLPQLLDSILGQHGFGCELEVVISDNASTDDTPVIAERYRDLFTHLVYHRAETNLGPDRNFLKAVELASGDFCWLMGSDDILEPGAIAAIEAVLLREPDTAGVLVRNNSYDLEMKNRIPIEGADQAFSRTTVLEGSENIFLHLGSHIGFISANIFDKKLWDKALASSPVEDFFNAWVYVYVIGRMISMHPKWVYLAEKCVGWRCGNDFLRPKGMFERMRIDVKGYDDIISALYGPDSFLRQNHLRHTLPHVRHRIMSAKVHGAERGFYRNSFAMLLHYYRRSPRFWLTCAPVFLVPGAAARMAKRLRGMRKRALAPAPGRA